MENNAKKKGGRLRCESENAVQDCDAKMLQNSEKDMAGNHVVYDIASARISSAGSTAQDFGHAMDVSHLLTR